MAVDFCPNAIFDYYTLPTNQMLGASGKNRLLFMAMFYVAGSVLFHHYKRLT
jgi:hypothetical protein